MNKLLRVISLSATLAASSAFAHSELTESVPADKAALEAAPKEVSLSFSEAVRLTALSVTKRGAEGAELGPLPAGTNRRFSIATAALTTGAYTVEWRALSGDGHVLRGAFSFTVGGVPASAEASAHHGAGAAEHSQHSEHAGHTEPH